MVKKNVGKLFILYSFFILFFQNVFAQEYKVGIAVWSGYPKCVQGFKDALADKGLVEGEVHHDE